MLDTPLKSLYFRGVLLVTIAMFRCQHWMLFSGCMFLFVFPPVFTKHHWNLFNPLKSNRTQFSHSNSLKSCRHSFDKSQLKVIFCSNVGDTSNFAIYNFLNCFERSKVPASQVQKLNQILKKAFEPPNQLILIPLYFLSDKLFIADLPVFAQTQTQQWSCQLLKPSRQYIICFAMLSFSTLMIKLLKFNARQVHHYQGSTYGEIAIHCLEVGCIGLYIVHPPLAVYLFNCPLHPSFGSLPVQYTSY